jgi:hypothetical protein
MLRYVVIWWRFIQWGYLSITLRIISVFMVSRYIWSMAAVNRCSNCHPLSKFQQSRLQVEMWHHLYVNRGRIWVVWSQGTKAVKYVYFIQSISMKTFDPRSSKLQYKGAEELYVFGRLLSKSARLSLTSLLA